MENKCSQSTKPLEFLYTDDACLTGYDHFGKLAISTKDKQMHTVWLSNYTPRYIPSRNDYICYHKDM